RPQRPRVLEAERDPPSLHLRRPLRLELDADHADLRVRARALEERAAAAEADVELERALAGHERAQVDRAVGRPRGQLVVADGGRGGHGAARIAAAAGRVKRPGARTILDLSRTLDVSKPGAHGCARGGPSGGEDPGR